MTFPTIHLNGTHPDSLLSGLCDAMSAIRAAMQAVAAAAPNGRDYYVQGQFTFAVAQEQHTARLQALQAVMEQLDQIANNILEQQSAQEAIKRGAR